MATGGRGRTWRACLVSGAAACLVLAACAGDSQAELEDRVAELEQENAQLREQLQEQGPGGGVATTVAGAGSTTTSTTGPPAPTTEPAPVRGSRERPIPLGRRIAAQDWVYRVLAFEPNVDEAVKALDETNSPAGDGNVYARLRLRAVYRGEGAGDPRRLNINLVSPDGASIGAAEICCKPDRDTLSDQAETFGGGTVEGWIYYAIPATDAFGGKFLGFDPKGDFPGVPGGLGFFEVN